MPKQQTDVIAAILKSSKANGPVGSKFVDAALAKLDSLGKVK